MSETLSQPSTDNNRDQSTRVSRHAKQESTLATNDRQATTTTSDESSRKILSSNPTYHHYQHHHQNLSDSTLDKIPQDEHVRLTGEAAEGHTPIDLRSVSRTSDPAPAFSNEAQQQSHYASRELQNDSSAIDNRGQPEARNPPVPSSENSDRNTPASVQEQLKDPDSQPPETSSRHAESGNAQNLMTKMQIGQILKDNNEHHKVHYHTDEHPVMLCMRPDGRLLEVDVMLYDDYDPDHYNHDANHERILLEVAQGRQLMTNNTSVMEKIIEQGGSRILRPEPPCLCYSCSKLFWNYGKGFVHVVKNQIASEWVTNWSRNTIHKAIEISNCLKRYEKSLRKRWSKKKIAERKNILKKIYPMMLSYQTLQKLLVNRQTLDPQHRKGFLTSNFNVDDLGSDPELLFQHLKNRAYHHPSAWFFTDFMRIVDMVSSRTYLHVEYAFGAFNITANDYGVWQEWRDHAVHQFEMVSAPMAMLVFESQSEILNVLHQVVGELVSDLQTPMAPILNDPHNWYALSTTPITTPEFFQVKSIFSEPSLPTFTFHQAVQLSKEQHAQYTENLAKLRSSNSNFVERIKLSSELEDASGKSLWNKQALIAYHTLAAPHERVIWWNLIAQSIELLAQRQVVSRKLNTNSAMNAYMEMFLEVNQIMHNRSEQLERIMKGCCYVVAKAHMIVPSEFIQIKDEDGQHGKELIRWISRNYTQDHTLAQHAISQDLLQNMFEEDSRNTGMVHPIFQEWLQEQVALRRVTAVLMACDPTRGLYQYQPFDQFWSMWEAMYPEGSGRVMYHSVLAERGEKIRACIRPDLKGYTLPSGPKNESWHEKHGAAVAALHETWAKYEKATMKYYEKTRGFKAPWLDLVSQVMRDTEPEQPASPASVAETPTAPLSTTTEAEATSSSLAMSSIPHYSSEVIVVAKTITKKKQKELNPPSDFEEDVATPPVEEATPARVIAAPLLESGEIAVKASSMDVVESLFSNAQQHVRAVRWRRFLNFMEDAGCSSEDGGGAGVRFSWRSVVDGSERKMVLHRPHPSSTLMAVHLRNVRESVEFCFGWTKRTFVERK